MVLTRIGSWMLRCSGMLLYDIRVQPVWYLGDSMSEIEIRAEAAEKDPMGQKIGALAAILAVCLAVVSIASHRAHTDAVVHRSEANDQWRSINPSASSPQPGAGRRPSEPAGHRQPGAAEPHSLRGEEKSTRRIARSREAGEGEGGGDRAHRGPGPALRHRRRDARNRRGAGVSYFIARRRLFPIVSITFGILGIAIAISGVLM